MLRTDSRINMQNTRSTKDDFIVGARANTAKRRIINDMTSSMIITMIEFFMLMNRRRRDMMKRRKREKINIKRGRD